MMPWGKKNEHYSFYQKLISLRKQEDVLRRGDYRTISAERGSRVYVFERFLEDERMRVILNMEDKNVEISKYAQNMQVVLAEGLNKNVLDAKGFVFLKS